ncbi:hypothetical protein Y032_0126g1334 [Ancylostoma ceylanicum]|uniref:Reverse transcriptase domain-containing protein n=1 Tax=Ancylostoma ceylanicum TaxID=53326 RepID=A0A016T8K3_9BILA|nr:hypothetical protein Y032_0126g1334 [Ancylostoma ceylanicum]
MEGLPRAWRESIVVPVFKKKGDALECGNYRGIKLICHTMKMFERLVDKWLKEVVEISNDQFGFVPGRSTIDPIFIVRQMMEKYREKGKEIHIAFLDLGKAYDRLPIAVLWDVVREPLVSEHLIRLVQDMYDGSAAFVRTSIGDTSSFVAVTGLHQGLALSPFLFIVVVDTVTQQLLEEPPFSLLYAEDIALLADTRNQLQRKVQMGQDTLAKASLKPNVKKTEFLSTGRDVEPITDVNGVAILQVNKFRYLGNILSEDGSVDMAVQETITSA